jgi:hypothetical protein
MMGSFVNITPEPDQLFKKVISFLQKNITFLKKTGKLFLKNEVYTNVHHS